MLRFLIPQFTQTISPTRKLPLQQSSQDDVNPPLPVDYKHSQQILLPNFPQVANTAPSPAINQPLPTEITPRRHAGNSSTSSSVSQQISPDDTPPAMPTRLRTHSNVSTHSTPAKMHIFMPQVMFQPLPVLQRGEGLEVDRNENETNEGITVNYFDADN
jgi:hypothetical protein